MRALLLLFVLMSVLMSAHAQVPDPPVCIPFFKSNDGLWQGSLIVYGEGPQCRWMEWACGPTDPTAGIPVKTYTLAGLKSANPVNTILGRLRVLENTADSDKERQYVLMWRALVTTPIDPICVAEIPK